MVHIQIFNPLQRLRELGRVFRRGSKALELAGDQGVVTGTVRADNSERQDCGVLGDFRELEPVYRDEDARASRDAEYYMHDSEGAFCVFLVEKTLFRVHRCYLTREPSVFSDMFRLPQANIQSSVDGASDETAIPLTDSAEQFRDFLWALYAPPCELTLYGKASARTAASTTLPRLLNVAEVSLKYCISSYEEWALERIYQLAQKPGPASFLRSASLSICARVLNVAAQAGHGGLLKLVEQRLISRVLWSDESSPSSASAYRIGEFRDVVAVAEHHGLRRLRGALYYKYLVEMVGSGGLGWKLEMISDRQLRQGMIGAQNRLANEVGGLHQKAPDIEGCCCASRDDCRQAWAKAWEDANMDVALGGVECRDIDLLSRLKAVRRHLRSTLPGVFGMGLSCTLTALEAIGEKRDRVIDELMDYFRTD